MYSTYLLYAYTVSFLGILLSYAYESTTYDVVVCISILRVHSIMHILYLYEHSYDCYTTHYSRLPLLVDFPYARTIGSSWTLRLSPPHPFKLE